MSINYTHTENTHNPAAATEVLPYIFNLISPDSIIDIGCGTGSWLKVAKQLGGKEILGIDGIHVDKNMLQIEENEFLQHNLISPLNINKKYDLAICLEVAEHLPENTAQEIVNLLTKVSDIVLFSAAIPGQDGQFHLNEQWLDYWKSKFEKHNYFPVDNLRPVFWDNAKVDWWYKQNMLLYAKKDVIDKFNLKVANHLPVYIHPNLLDLKVQMLDDAKNHISYLEALIDTEINKPKFIPSFKKLIKSLLR